MKTLKSNEVVYEVMTGHAPIPKCVIKPLRKGALNSKGALCKYCKENGILNIDTVQEKGLAESILFRFEPPEGSLWFKQIVAKPVLSVSPDMEVTFKSGLRA